MVGPDRVRVWSARLAAPVAFFLAATVLVVLVQRAVGSGDDDQAGGAGTTIAADGTSSPATAPDHSGKPGHRCARRYRVRGGDTLESIAARCSTDVETLRQLNPGIDPLALSPGQRIRVRKKGA
jgi:LysM repeat protein